MESVEFWIQLAGWEVPRRSTALRARRRLARALLLAFPVNSISFHRLHGRAEYREAALPATVLLSGTVVDGAGAFGLLEAIVDSGAGVPLGLTATAAVGETLAAFVGADGSVISGVESAPAWNAVPGGAAPALPAAVVA